MIQKLINYYLYPLKKKGKFKSIFLFYRNWIIFKKLFKYFSLLFFEKIDFFNFINFNTKISLYTLLIDKIIDNKIKFSNSKIEYYINKADNLYLNNKNKIRLNPYVFYKEYAQLKLLTLNFKSYFAVKKEYNEILLKLQANDLFYKKNIRFIKAKDIYNTIGLSYITDVTLKSSELGLIPNYKYKCLNI